MVLSSLYALSAGTAELTASILGGEVRQSTARRAVLVVDKSDMQL